MKSSIGLILEGLHQSRVNEDEWKTMHGAHILIDGDGDIIAGGPEHMRKKTGKKNADAKSKNDNKSNTNFSRKKLQN